MSKMTPEQLAQHEAVEIMLKENELYARHAISEIKGELALESNPDEAVFLYLYLQEFSADLKEEMESFVMVAPLVKLDMAEFEVIKVAATARKAEEDKEVRREINMRLAKARVEEAIVKFGQDSDQCRMAMANAIQYLPADLKASVDAKARELGLMPVASGYTADNEPVFTVESLAKHFDMEPEQVMQDAGEFAMTVDASTIHRTQ